MKRLLTDAVLRQTLPVDGRVEISDGAVRGLRIRGRRSSAQWLLRRSFGAAKRVRINIGEWPHVGVEDARAIAGEILLRAARGEDVEQIACRSRPSITVAELIDRWETSRSANLRTAKKTARELRNGLTNKMLAMSAMELTREIVLGHFDEMAVNPGAKWVNAPAE